MFAKPEVGKTVTVTTDWSDYFKTFEPHVRVGKDRIVKVGEVVASEHFDDPASFRMTTGISHYPVCVVPLSYVTALEYVDGTAAVETEQAPQEDKETWTVSGSKGNEYVVTRNSTMWSCTCPGYGFRRQCKHINEKKQEVLDRS